jgi:glycosyl transferase, family 25
MHGYQKINSFFGTICVINLRSRPDRRIELADHIGLSFQSPHLTLFEASKPDNPAGFETAGVRGCFMSHLQVLRDAMQQGTRSVLILEDDLNFCENFNSRFDTVADWLEANEWGMFYGTYFLAEPLVQSGAACTRVDPAQPIGTSAFVAVNGKHIGALIQHLEAMLQRAPGDARGGPMHIDGAYCWFRQSHPEVLTCLSSDPLGFQRSSRTDVLALRWFDRFAGSAWLVARLRRWRNRSRRQG